jgi:hypothetical protein
MAFLLVSGVGVRYSSASFDYVYPSWSSVSYDFLQANKTGKAGHSDPIRCF